MAALRSSLSVVYALAPCEMPRARFVVHETGPAAAPRPRPLERVRQPIAGPHDSRPTGQPTRARRDWDPPAPPVADDALVAVRLGFAQAAMRERVKQAGGTWNPSRQV